MSPTAMSPTAIQDTGSSITFDAPEFATRFGRLLTSTRRRAKRSIADMVVDAGDRFDEMTLQQLERGTADLDDLTVDAACQLYRADLGTILPERKPVTVAPGRLAGGGVTVEFSPEDPASLLIGYLELIRSMRRQEKSPAIALRRDDIVAIAEHLGVDGSEIIDRLTALMGATTSQRNTMAMLFAAGAIVIGLAAAGGQASAHVAGSGQTGVAGNARVVEVVDVATAVENPGSVDVADIVEVADVPEIGAIVGPAAAGSGSADRVGSSFVVTAPAAAAASPPGQNQSSCNPDPSDAVMNVVIPAIGYDCPVYAGGQSMIDAGFVTLVTDVEAHPTLARRPGDPGTLWLAGHRTTNGAAFADVPDLADGALITVGSGDATATYRVVGRIYVEVRNGRVVDGSGQATAAATRDSIIRSDLGGNLAPRLVLQTCEGEDHRWMIYADLV